MPEAKEVADNVDGSASSIREALKQFSSSTAIGADQIHLRRLASLPDVALVALGAIFKQSVSNLTVPAQELLNVLGLLGKKLGGSRNQFTAR